MWEQGSNLTLKETPKVWRVYQFDLEGATRVATVWTHLSPSGVSR